MDFAEVNLLDYNRFGPCDVTLTPKEPCEQEEDNIKCPYHFNVPPLTIHLPKEFRELERMVEELQMLKDDVDELRRMCADCTVRQPGRECERESDFVNERMNRNEDGRIGLNADLFKDLSPEHGSKRVTPRPEGYMESDAEKNVLEEKENNKEGAERQSTAAVINDEKRVDRKQVVDTNGTFSTQREEDKRATNAGGRGKLVDLVLKSIFEKNIEGEIDDGKNDRNGKENSRGDGEGLLEKGADSVITADLKIQQKTDDNNSQALQNRTKEMEIKSQSKENRSSYVRNMSDFHREHTNNRQQQHVEERKREMEKGIKVAIGNQHLKQAEGKDREKASRKGEVEEKKETGTRQEIKTKGEKIVESAQTDGDRGVASSKGQTPAMGPGGPRHHSVGANAALSYRSPPGPPAFSSLTSPFPWTNKDLTTTSAGMQVQTMDLSASFIMEPGFRTTGRPTAAPVNARSASAAPGANFSRAVRPTMTTTATTKVVTVAAFPGVLEHHNSTAGKNLSSNTKTGTKPLPGIKNPKVKNAKINTSYNQGHLADKKTKQKQKPPYHKSATKTKHKDPLLVQGQKPSLRTGNLPADLNLKNTRKNKNVGQNTTNQNLPNIQNSDSPQKPFLPAQRPMFRQRNQPVNVNNPDRYPPTEQRPNSAEIPNISPNPNILKVGNKRIHLLKTEKTLKKTASEEKAKLNQKPELNQGLRNVSENTQTTNVQSQPKLLSQNQNSSVTPAVNLEPGTMSNPKEPRLETPQQGPTPRPPLKPVSEPNPEAHSSPAPLSKQRSHARPAETPGQRSKASTALKPISETETDSDPFEMTRATLEAHKTSQTNRLPPPGSAKPSAGVNIHPTGGEVASIRVMIKESGTYSSLEDGPNPDLITLPDHVPGSPDSRVISDLRPQTSAPTPSIQATTTPNRETSRSPPSVFQESGPEPFYSEPKSNEQSKHREEDTQIQLPKPGQTTQKAQILEHYRQRAAGPPVIHNPEAARPIQHPAASLTGPPTESGETLRADLNSDPELTTADNNESEPGPDGGSGSATQQPGSEDRRTLKRPPLPPKPALPELWENSANSGSTPLLPDQSLDSRKEFPQIKPKPVPAPKPGLKLSGSDLTTEPETENSRAADKTSPVNAGVPDLTPDPVLEPVSDGALGAGYDEPSSPPLTHRSPFTPTAEPRATSAQKICLFPLKSGSKSQTDPPQATSDPLHNSQMNLAPSSGLVKLLDTEVSTIRMTALDPKSSSSQDAQTFPHRHHLPGDFTANPNSRIMSRQKSQTTAAALPIPMTRSPGRIIPPTLSSVPPNNRPTQPKQASNVDSKLHHNTEKTTKSQIYDSNKEMNAVSSSSSPDLGSTSPAKPEALAPDVSTDSARELRVKINQVATFFNNSRSTSGRHPERPSTDHAEDKQKGSRPDGINSKLLTRLPSKGKTWF